MEIDIAIKEATSILRKFKIKSPIIDTEILMSEAINKDRKFIILNKDYKIKKNSLKYFKDLIEKRSKGMPISYLTKKKIFLEK